MEQDFPDDPEFWEWPDPNHVPSTLTPANSPKGSQSWGSLPGGSRSGGPDPTFDIYAFDAYQVPVPGRSVSGSDPVRRQVTFMVLRRSPAHMSLVAVSSLLRWVSSRIVFQMIRTLYAQQGAGWIDELVSWAINHSRVTGEDQRLLSADRRNDPWLSQFMTLIPSALRSQTSEVIGIEVAKLRAPVLHAHLVQDARGYIGNAVHYLTPREVRNVQVRQFQEVGQAAALDRFRALRYDLRDVGGWFANSLQFTNADEAAGVNYRDRYNQVYAWLHARCPLAC
jgi:hypothetical protein